MPAFFYVAFVFRMRDGRMLPEYLQLALRTLRMLVAIAKETPAAEGLGFRAITYREQHAC